MWMVDYLVMQSEEEVTRLQPETLCTAGQRRLASGSWPPCSATTTPQCRHSQGSWPRFILQLPNVVPCKGSGTRFTPQLGGVAPGSHPN